jgi:hypothetical protein
LFCNGSNNDLLYIIRIIIMSVEEWQFTIKKLINGSEINVYHLCSVLTMSSIVPTYKLIYSPKALVLAFISISVQSLFLYFSSKPTLQSYWSCE